MSQQTVKQSSRASSPKTPTPAEAATTHRDVPYLLSQMTYGERGRAYESHVYSRRELSIAAARRPGEMPELNGEFEHIAYFLADNED